METIDSRQLRLFSQCVLEIHQASSADAVAEAAMLAAEKLVGGEHGYFFEFFAGGGMRLLAERTGPSLSAYLPVLAAHHREHPGVRFCLEDPKGGPTKVTDFLSVRDWHRTEIYQSFCRPLGIEENCGVDFRPAGGNTHAIVINRSRRSFTRKDLSLFGLLRDHVTAALESIGRADDTSMRIDADGRLLQASPQAELLLQRWFPRRRAAHLPEELRAWARARIAASSSPGSAPAAPLRLTGKQGRLEIRIRPAPGSFELTLSGSPAPASGEAIAAGLTRRQREVFEWVAAGKSNPEIACILGTGVETVKTHVKAIYEKLGVESRPAAIALFHESR
jgi:DNA-binding CsgD family transcriptional regulator